MVPSEEKAIYLETYRRDQGNNNLRQVAARVPVRWPHFSVPSQHHLTKQMPITSGAINPLSDY